MTGPAGALPPRPEPAGEPVTTIGPPPEPAGEPVTTIGPRSAGTTGPYPAGRAGRGIDGGTSCLSVGREDADGLSAAPSRAADAD
ncbi:hypothetical protein AB0O68_31210 [Streptomyces sp. NPDC087512]|uniref:hypothetical protein n=1 Tax=Streptomyces sp. NPDC087512 TaxID=3155059 RepID=UPI00343BB253